MAEHVKNLTDVQNETLKQFRKNLSDILTHKDSDPVLLKWLKARNFNLSKAETLFRQTYYCKKVLGIDNIIHTYQKPEVMEKYEFNTFLGFAKDHTPVRYLAFGTADCLGFIMSLCGYGLYKACSYVIEEDIRNLMQEKSRTGLEISEITYILDLKGFSLQDYLYKSVIEVALQLSNIFQDFYPEICRNVFCINAPVYFDIFYKILKPVLRFSLLEKMHVVPRGSNAEVLLKYIDADVLPVFLGGSGVDCNGDPMCSAFMKIGGKIPEKYYIRNHTLPLSTDDLGVISVWVPARGVFNHSVVVHKPDSKISTEFRTEDGGIQLSLLFRELGPEPELPNIPRYDEYVDAKDSKNTRVKQFCPPSTFQSHLAQVFTICKAPMPGVYIFKFETTGNWFASRRLIYRIQLVED